MNEIAVVILNWNTRHFLQQFLPDVVRYSPGAEIIVADNASTDDSVEYVRSNFPNVKLIINKTNEGFAGGYNTALKQVKAKYFMLLNSDVKVTDNWLNPLKELLDADNHIAAVQPKILSFHNPEMFEYAGAAGGYIDKFGYPFCRGRIFNSLEKDENQYDDNVPVFWATGACLLIRSKVFEDLTGFDVNFFAHMEEIDLCWRINRAGHSIYYCGKSVVYHVGGGTLSKGSPHKTFLNFRNNLLMIYKNTPKNSVSGLFLTRIILDAVASVKFLLTDNYQNFKAVWKARSEFHKLKSQYSRPVQKEKSSDSVLEKLIYPRSIVWDYYLCNRSKFSDLRWISNRKPKL